MNSIYSTEILVHVPIPFPQFYTYISYQREFLTFHEKIISNLARKEYLVLLVPIFARDFVKIK